MFLYLPHTDPGIHYTPGTRRSTVTTVSAWGGEAARGSAKAIPSPDKAVTALPKPQIKQDLCSPQHRPQQPLGSAALGSCCRLAALQLTGSLEQLASVMSKPAKVMQTTLSTHIAPVPMPALECWGHFSALEAQSGPACLIQFWCPIYMWYTSIKYAQPGLHQPKACLLPVPHTARQKWNFFDFWYAAKTNLFGILIVGFLEGLHQ